MTTSDPTPMNPENVPHAMRGRDQWLVARLSPDSGRDKWPALTADGRSWGNRDQLLSFDEALKEYRSPESIDSVRDDEFPALAYVFAESDPFVGLDFDDVQALSTVEEIVDGLGGGYVEWSQSGNGLHVIVRGSIPANVAAQQPLGDGTDLEVYDSERYFVMTGDVHDEQGSIPDASVDVEEVLTSHVAGIWDDEESDPSPSADEPHAMGTSIADRGRRSAMGRSADVDPNELTVEEVRETALHYDDEFGSLWSGDHSHYRSVSEADMALASKLAFWCQGHLGLMDRCFRASGLYDVRDDLSYPKWDRELGSTTYGRYTLRKAVRMNPESFSGTYLDPES